LRPERQAGGAAPQGAPVRPDRRAGRIPPWGPAHLVRGRRAWARGGAGLFRRRFPRIRPLAGRQGGRARGASVGLRVGGTRLLGLLLPGGRPGGGPVGGEGQPGRPDTFWNLWGRQPGYPPGGQDGGRGPPRRAGPDARAGTAALPPRGIGGGRRRP